MLDMACNVHNMQNMTKHMLDTARNMALNMQNIHLSPMRKITFQAMFSKKIVGCADFQVMIGWIWGRAGRGTALFGVWCQRWESLSWSPLQAPLARPIGQTHWPDPTKPLPHDPTNLIYKMNYWINNSFLTSVVKGVVLTRGQGLALSPWHNLENWRFELANFCSTTAALQQPSKLGAQQHKSWEKLSWAWQCCLPGPGLGALTQPWKLKIWTCKFLQHTSSPAAAQQAGSTAAQELGEA